MGIIGDGLEAATERVFTRPVPKSAPARMRFLVRTEKTTRAVARLLGVSQRTVERYVKGQIKRPRPELADRLASEVRARWQPRVRQRARRRAATAGGIAVETRARFGFTAAPGTSDDGRMRRITQHLPPVYAARLFEAQASGASDARLRAVVAEELQEVSFRDGGRRAPGLVVEFTDVDYIDFDL